MPRRFTIGRERSCDVAIADDSVSRVHAEIWLADDGTLMLEDRGSSNGTTLIRGGLIHAGQSSPLKNEVVLPGDQIRFGGVTLGVRDVIEAVESKFPAALTPAAAKVPKAGPMPAPMATPAAVTPARAVPPPLPPPLPVVATPAPRAAQAPPPLPSPSSALPSSPSPASPSPASPSPARRAGGGQVIRCECGAIKTVGQICPGCNQ
jgi:predicted component of type VI protein secretion system